MEVDINKIRILAESAERRAKDIHKQVLNMYPLDADSDEGDKARSLLNDFFYWSGKATSYRGIVAMAEMQAIVEEELEEEGSCP